jgi:hypothetical protein
MGRTERPELETASSCPAKIRMYNIHLFFFHWICFFIFNLFFCNPWDNEILPVSEL